MEASPPAGEDGGRAGAQAGQGREVRVPIQLAALVGTRLSAQPEPVLRAHIDCLRIGVLLKGGQATHARDTRGVISPDA